MSTLIKFSGRNLSDMLNQKLVQLARDPTKFDVDLVSTNGRVVPANRLILAMYSPYLRRLLKNASPENKYIVLLADFPVSVLEKVVELFYYGEIRVLSSIKGKVYKALKFLEVDIPEPLKPKPRPKNPSPDQLYVDGELAKVNTANEKSSQPVQNFGQQQQTQPQQQQQKQQQQQQQQKPREQKQPPAKQTQIPVATANTQSRDAINAGNGSGNSDGNAHAKSAPISNAALGLNGKVSEGAAQLVTNGATATTSNSNLNKSGFNPNLLYDDDIDANMEELEKSIGDLITDIGGIGQTE